MAKKLSLLRDRNLLLQSTILDDYPELKLFYINNPNIKDDSLDSLDDETRKLFENNIYDKVVKNALNEWKLDKSKVEVLENKKEKCMLCNSEIKNICYIKNGVNGKVLKIGRFCAKHFGIASDADIDKLFKEREKLIKIKEIDLKIDNIESILHNSDLIINQSEIVIKDSVKNTLLNLKVEGEGLYKEYVDNKLDESRKKEIINRLKIITEDIYKEKERISSYIDEFRNHDLVVTKNIIKSLNSDYETAKSLNKDGFI